jgi:putative FmdB family regulatory protein
MPIYEYLCTKCKCEFEILKLSTKDPEPQCPSCCSQEVQRLMSAGAVRPEGIPVGKGGFNAPKCRPSGG